MPKESLIHVAKKYYAQAAEKGHGYSCFMLGSIAKDEGNNELAFKSFRKGYDLKHEYSAYELGRCFDKGIGTPVDENSAFECYKYAADHGVAEAAYQVAATYADGLEDVVAKDLEMSLKYMTQAFDGGYKTAGQMLPIYYINGLGTPVDLEKAAEIAAIGRVFQRRYTGA